MEYILQYNQIIPSELNDDFFKNYIGQNFDYYIFIQACVNDNIDMVKWLAKNYPQFIEDCQADISIWESNHYAHPNRSFNGIIELLYPKGNLSIFRFILTNCRVKDKTLNMIFVHSCEYGHLELAQWLKNKWPDIDHRFNSDRFNDHSFNGDSFNIFRYHKSEFISDYAFCQACANGHICVAKWLKKNWPDIDHCANSAYAFRLACANGHICVAKWLINTFSDITPYILSSYAFRYACINGHISVAKWLINNWPDIDKNANKKETFEKVCANGKLEIAKLLRIRWWGHNPLDDIIGYDSLIVSCNKGDLLLFKWLLRQYTQYAFDINQAFDTACLYGYIDMAKWIKEYWTNVPQQTTLDMAVSNACIKGKLDLLVWLCSFKNPIPNIRKNDDAAFRYACENGHLIIAIWLIHHFPIDIQAKSNYAFRYACANGHMDVAQWLKNKCSNINLQDINSAFYLACEKGNLNIAQWLLKQWPTIDLKNIAKNIFLSALENDFVNVAYWIYKLCPIDTTAHQNLIEELIEDYLYDAKKISQLKEFLPYYIIV